MLGYNYPGSRWYQEAYALMTGSGAPAEARRRLVRTSWSAASEPHHIKKTNFSLPRRLLYEARRSTFAVIPVLPRRASAPRAGWIWRQHPGGFSA